MVFAIILDQCNILYAIYGAQAICKFQIRVFAEYLYRHFGAILAHGLGLYHKFAAAKGAHAYKCFCGSGRKSGLRGMRPGALRSGRGGTGNSSGYSSL